MSQQIQATKKAVTSGRIKAGKTINGEVVVHAKTPPAKPGKPVSVEAVLKAPKRMFPFDAADWTKARKAYDADVKDMLDDIDNAIMKLRWQARMSTEASWRTFASMELTGAWPVIEA